MAERSGASSLTALLAVAGLVGLSIVGFRAYSGSPVDADLAMENCPLLGEDCDMAVSKRACCPSHDHDVVLASNSSECKNLEDGCDGDGTNGCCGGCGEKAEEAGKCCSEKAANGEEAAACEDKVTCCSEKAANGSEKASCEDKAKGCSEKAANGSEKASCSEKAEACADKAEKAATCCSQRDN